MADNYKFDWMMTLRIKYLAFALLSAALLLSCTKEWQGPDGPGESEDRITSVVHYRVTVGEGSDTKSSLNHLNQYIFETGDQLYVVSGTDMYGVLNLVAGAGDTHATFEGDLMCLDDFTPGDGTLLSATLVSRDDKIHTCADGKITATSYPDSGADAYAASFADAIRRFSDFTAENTFGAHSFSLEQKSSFLMLSVTFNDSEAAALSASATPDTLVATISNGGTPLRSGGVAVEEIDFSTQANFVAAFASSPATALSGATVSFATKEATPVGAADGITNATLQANRYYEVFRSHVDLDFFTVQAREAGTTVTFNYTGDVEYRLNSGSWTTYSSSITLVNQKDYVQFRSKRTSYNSGTPIFTADKPCYIYGNIMSLICDSSFNPKTTLDTKAFQNAFKGATWIDIPAGRPLKLTATTLGTYCYNYMFTGCTSLSRPPEIQTTLTANVPTSAYAYMFQNCTALVSAPELPSWNSTTSAEIIVGASAYQSMFVGCSSLTTVPATIVGTSGKQACDNMFTGCSSLANAPALPSNTVGEKGYFQMFKRCYALVQAPELPAMTLGVKCYNEMFIDCTSLLSAPSELPATSLSDYCYMDMFKGCLSLANVPASLPATISAASCYRGMFDGCISLNHAPEINLEDLKTNSCRSMFNGCTSLVTATGLEKVTSVADSSCIWMFKNCGELITTPSELKATTLGVSSYNQMYYNCAKITEAPDIQATSVSTYSCYQMFYGCRRLRTPPPALAVASVAGSAFEGMFQGCTNLASGPDFTGMTTVGEKGCMNMFNGCTNLTVPPELPATTLSASSYEGMFKGSALTEVPLLPATTLASNCYKSMFENCKYLEGPAVLPAPTLVTGCYHNMFKGASKLNSVVCLATDHFASDCTNAWLESVAATGTFVRPAGVAWTIDSASGIPTGWTATDTGIDPIFPDGGPFDPEEDL